MNQSVGQRIKSIVEHWLLTEPMFLSVYCSHELVPNVKMHCPIRTGNGRIEINTILLSEFDNKRIEELLKIELIRILLKHPYERQPNNTPHIILTIASNCVIADNYQFSKIKLTSPKDIMLPPGNSFEAYISLLLKSKIQQINNESIDKDKNSQLSENQTTTESFEEKNSELLSLNAQRALNDTSELWSEDEMRASQINQIIISTSRWGTIPQKLITLIEASTHAHIDYRKILTGFRASILSNHRYLTRLRPNRRTDFENYGSIYKFSTKLLVAIDVSGSISNAAIADFYAIINRFFKYGIEQIDTVQFDSEMGEVTMMRKAMRKPKVIGRGGTDIQPVIDYATTTRYDGIVIFTDGYAPIPNVGRLRHTHILWICPNLKTFNDNHLWMEKIGRCCVIKQNG